MPDCAPPIPLRTEAQRILALALPIMGGQISQMLMALADSLMVGRVGVIPLAAASFATGLLNVPTIFGIGLLACISVLVAQSHGRGDRPASGEILRHGIFLGLVSGAVMVAILWLLAGQLGRFGQPPAVVAAAVPYFLITSFSILPMLLAISLNQFSEALNHPWPPMIILLGSVALNVGLNWVLIYGNLGAPALGLAGAGWATLISRTLSALVLLFYVLRARRFEGAVPVGWTAPILWSRLRALLAIGLPSSMQVLFEVGAFATGAVMMGWIGAGALAAHQIAITCAATAFMFPLGVSIATSICVGQIVGAGEIARLRRVGLSAWIMTAVMMCCFAALFLGFGRPIARAFVADPAVIALAAAMLAVAGVFQVADGIQVLGMGALRGLSDVRVPTLIAFTAYWVIAIPAAYLLAFRFGHGAVGIWIGLALGLGTSAVALTIRFAIKSRRPPGGCPAIRAPADAIAGW